MVHPLRTVAAVALTLSAATACQPTGQVESLVSDFDATAGSGDIVVDGWADDLDANGPIPVRVMLDGERVVDDEAAELLRTQTVSPGPLLKSDGPRRFSVVLDNVGPGEHEVCVEVINSGVEDDDADLGCTSVVVGQLQSDLFAARRQWAVAQLDTYTLRYSRVCFCTPESLGPFEVTVIDGVATSDSKVPNTAMTADDLFDLVQEAIDRPAAVLRVTYDERTGVPRSIFIDWNAMMADEETSLTIDAIIPKIARDTTTTTVIFAPHN